MRGKTAEAERRDRVEARLLDAINDVPSPNFFLALRTFAAKPGRQPSARRLQAFLRKELVKYDPDLIVVDPGNASMTSFPTLRYQDDTLTATVALIPRSAAARGRTDIRSIGMYPIQVQRGDAREPIRAAVKAKATRYGELDAPYVLAVNCASAWGADDEDVAAALFGSEQVTFYPGSQEPERSRARDGALIGPGGPVNTRVSAVLCGAVFPWSLSDPRLALIANPWATRPVGDLGLGLREGSVVEGVLRWSGQTSLLELFGLPKGWPGAA